MRPQTGYYDTLIEEAADLMESLALNLPFSGREQADRLLHHRCLPPPERPFHRLRQQRSEAHQFFMELFETHTFRLQELHAWLQGHVKPLPVLGQ